MIFHFRAFIAAAECGRQVEAHVDTAIEKAAETSELLPELRQKSVQFEQTSQVQGQVISHQDGTQVKSNCQKIEIVVFQELLQRRKRLSLVLSKHTSLLEILELPQLVENAVRNQVKMQSIEGFGP